MIMNMTNDGLCIQEMFIAWLKMMMVVLLHMKTIHMKTSDDGTMLIKRLVKGACELCKIPVDQVASINLIVVMQVCILLLMTHKC
jgi:hypothetical protein